MQLRVFNRHCAFSTASAEKLRPASFSREECFRSLLGGDSGNFSLHLFYDCARGEWSSHFTSRPEYTDRLASREIFEGGTEAGAFLALLDHIVSKDFSDDDVIYIVEDDYMHRPGWVEALLDAGLQTPANYWTLYDNPDKYENSLKLPSRIFLGNVCHWRETPSTTNTFATRFKTLKEDIRLFRKYSTGVSV